MAYGIQAMTGARPFATSPPHGRHGHLLAREIAELVETRCVAKVRAPALTAFVPAVVAHRRGR
jgi:hypothetical protein